MCECEVCGVIRCNGAWKIGYEEEEVWVCGRMRSEMQFPQKAYFKDQPNLTCIHPSALVNA